MKANQRDVHTGIYYIDGDVASAEGALAAGCKFVGGYPITPSTEAFEAFVRRAPYVGSITIQMEDELGSIASVLGAAWSGKKAMTITSGPGFSLMMENIGLGAMLETPFVILNIQRGGPSTGLPTLAGQADMMQSRWGSHGDYEIIAISPDSPQELFDYTIKAFNLSEKYRCPVMIMSDECVGHMTEKVVIPTAEEIELEPRRFYIGPKDKYQPFKPDKDLVPPMVKAGDGFKLHITGLIHDENGYPASNKTSYTRRLVDKIRLNADKIIELQEEETEDAEIIIVSYGITSRVAIRGIEEAKEAGIKVGSLRLVTVWPFPEKRIAELSKKVRAFVVPEINYGQIVYEVERCSHGNANVILVPHGGGLVHNPDDIFHAIQYASKEKNKIIGIVEYKTILQRLIAEKGNRLHK